MVDVTTCIDKSNISDSKYDDNDNVEDENYRPFIVVREFEKKKKVPLSEKFWKKKGKSTRPSSAFIMQKHVLNTSIDKEAKNEDHGYHT